MFSWQERMNRSKRTRNVTVKLLPPWKSIFNLLQTRSTEIRGLSNWRVYESFRRTIRKAIPTEYCQEKKLVTKRASLANPNKLTLRMGVPIRTLEQSISVVIM